MEKPIGVRIRSAWNAFLSREPTSYKDVGPSYAYRSDKPRTYKGREKSIANSIVNRIAVDCAQVDIRHVKLDENNRYIGDVESTLNERLSLSANIDQTGRAFVQDAVQSMFDEGHVVLLPVDTDRNPDDGSFKIDSIRVGRVTQWYPSHVRVEAYNEISGRREEVVVSKNSVCIIENPLYSIMNEPNSTMQRLIRKLALLDSIDEQTGSGKIDLIIQLPYSIRSEAKKKEAENRRKAVETQLIGSKYGIAYVDGTEKITQLNRPLENNLLTQIEYLTNQVFAQLGITEEILNGSADEQTMLNYYSRTIEPILTAIVEEIKRKFLTQTARTQRQTIMFFRDPFKLIPVAQVAELADKMTRNEIMSSNEIRQVIGMRPSSDPAADELRNKNLSQTADQIKAKLTGEPTVQNVEDDVSQVKVKDITSDEIKMEKEE